MKKTGRKGKLYLRTLSWMLAVWLVVCGAFSLWTLWMAREREEEDFVQDSLSTWRTLDQLMEVGPRISLKDTMSALFTMDGSSALYYENGTAIAYSGHVVRVNPTLDSHLNPSQEGFLDLDRWLSEEEREALYPLVGYLEVSGWIDEQKMVTPQRLSFPSDPSYDGGAGRAEWVEAEDGSGAWVIDFEPHPRADSLFYFTADQVTATVYFETADTGGGVGSSWERERIDDATWVLQHEGDWSTTGLFTLRSYGVQRLKETRYDGVKDLLLLTAQEVNNLKACAPTLLTAAFGSLAVFLAAALLLSGQLWKTEERQRRLEEERRELTAALAHDLKTPLAAIQGYAELLEQGSVPEKEAAYRAGLHTQTAKMDRLLGEMLELSRLEDGGLTLRAEEVDLGALADGLLARYEAAVREKGITLCRTGEERVTGDPELVERALDNLLSNAVRHCAEGGRVTVALTPGRCTVRNTGEALAEDVLARMWDPYYKGDDARQGGRAGLGLTIVRRICTLHGFTWGAENGEEGPEVWFSWEQT